MGVGSGGGSRVGEIRLELEQDGECGSGREEFGTEGSREQELAVLPAATQAWTGHQSGVNPNL